MYLQSFYKLPSLLNFDQTRHWTTWIFIGSRDTIDVDVLMNWNIVHNNTLEKEFNDNVITKVRRAGSAGADDQRGLGCEKQIAID